MKLNLKKVLVFQHLITSPVLRHYSGVVFVVVLIAAVIVMGEDKVNSTELGV